MAFVPYQTAGERCGGFVAGPEFVLRCAPNARCSDIPPLLPDAPGICRVTCNDNDGCAAESYCDSTNVCREDGQCFHNVDDCSREGNDYPVPACVGNAVCNETVCGWVCGGEDRPMRNDR